MSAQSAVAPAVQTPQSAFAIWSNAIPNQRRMRWIEYSFDVSRGEIFGLLGPNGAGKTTTIGVLTTAIVPTEGSASLAASTSREIPSILNNGSPSFLNKVISTAV